LSSKLFRYEFLLSEDIKKIKYFGLIDSADQIIEDIRLDLSDYLKDIFLRKRKRVEEFEYPCCLCAFLVHIGSKTFEEGNFWSSIFQALDIKNATPRTEQQIGELFIETCRKGEGFYFPHPGKRFVVSILAHGFVPDSFIKKWVRFIRVAFPEIGSAKPVSEERIEREIANIKDKCLYEEEAKAKEGLRYRNNLDKLKVYWPLVELYREEPEAVAYYTDFLENPTMLQLIGGELPENWVEKEREAAQFRIRKELASFLEGSPYARDDRLKRKLVTLKENYQKKIDRIMELKESITRINRVRNLLLPGKLVSMEILRRKLAVVHEWKESHPGFLSWDTVKDLYHYAKKNAVDSLEDLESHIGNANPSRDQPMSLSNDRSSEYLLCEATKRFLIHSGNDANVFLRSNIEYIRSLNKTAQGVPDEKTEWPLLSERLKQGIKRVTEFQSRLPKTIRQNSPYLELDFDSEQLWLVIPPVIIDKCYEKDKVSLSVLEGKTKAELFSHPCSLFDKGDYIETERIQREILPLSGPIEIRIFKENGENGNKEVIRDFSLTPRLCEECPFLIFDEDGEELKGREYSTDTLYLFLPKACEVLPPEIIADEAEWFGSPDFSYIILDLTEKSCFQVRGPDGESCDFSRANYYGKLSENPLEGITVEGERAYFRCPKILMPPITEGSPAWKIGITLESGGQSNYYLFEPNHYDDTGHDSSFLEVCPADCFDFPYGRYSINILSGDKKPPGDVIFWMLPKFRFRWNSEDRNPNSPGVFKIEAEDDVEFSRRFSDQSATPLTGTVKEALWRVDPEIRDIRADIMLKTADSEMLKFTCDFERPVIEEISFEGANESPELSQVFYGYPLKKEFLLPYDLRGKRFECWHEQTGQVCPCSVKNGLLTVDLRPFFDNIRASEVANQSFSIYEQSSLYARVSPGDSPIPVVSFSFSIPFADSKIALDEDAEDQTVRVHCRWEQEDNDTGLCLRLSTATGFMKEALLTAECADHCFVVSKQEFGAGCFSVEWVVGTRIAREYEGEYEPGLSYRPLSSAAFSIDDILSDRAALAITKVSDDEDNEYPLERDRCIIRNIRRTDLVEEGEPFEGEVIWVDRNDEIKLSLGTNPVKFFINFERKTLPFLIDNKKDGVCYDLSEKDLYWVVKNDPEDKEDILVERIHVAFWRRNHAD